MIYYSMGIGYNVKNGSPQKMNRNGHSGFKQLFGVVN